MKFKVCVTIEYFHIHVIIQGAYSTAGTIVKKPVFSKTYMFQQKLESLIIYENGLKLSLFLYTRSSFVFVVHMDKKAGGT